MPDRAFPAACGNRGFTLIELMIALVLGSLLTLALMSFFVFGNRSYRQDDQVAKMQDELRFAMAQITRDIEMTAFWDSILDATKIEPGFALAIDDTDDCGSPSGTALNWVFDLTTPLDLADDVTADVANEFFPCIAEDEFKPETDIIAVKRVSADPVYTVEEGAVDALDAGTLAGMQPNQVYLWSTGARGYLFKLTNASPEAGNTDFHTYWKYQPVVYYIRRYTDIPPGPGRPDGDGIPSLCRKVLSSASGSPSMQVPESTECIATGIEDMQIEYGVDVDRSGNVAYYWPGSATDADELEIDERHQLARTIVAARVTLVVRSERPDAHYSTAKTFRVGATKETTINDGHYRKTLTTTVLLRNRAAQNRDNGAFGGTP